MGAEPAGENRFRIGFVAGVTLSKWTRAWAERRPDLPLEIVRATIDEQSTMLHEDRADVVFVRLPVEREGLSVIPLYEEAPFVVAGADSALADADSLTVTNLASQNIIRFPDDIAEWRILGRSPTTDRTPLAASPSVEDAVELVAAGVGILLVPQSIARLHNRKDVVHRPIVDLAPTRIALAWLEERTTPEIEDFIGIVRGRTPRSSRTAASASGAAAEPESPKKKVSGKKADAGGRTARGSGPARSRAPKRSRRGGR